MRKLSAHQFGHLLGGEPQAEQTHAERLYGSHDLEGMFGNHPKTTTPWPRASRRKDVQDYDKDLVRRTLETPLRGAHDLYEVDPRHLHASQPWITHQGVAHYMKGDYEKTGRTFADQHDVGNQYPFVYSRHGQHVLLSGHHRAAAALLQGRSLRARYVEGGWGAPR